MTREEAIKSLKVWLSKGTDGMTNERLGYLEGWFHKKDKEAFDMAIEALKQIDEIKKIISADVYIQEDVLRYKMICEVVSK